LYFRTIKGCPINFHDKKEPLQEEMSACRGGSHAIQLKEEPTPPPRRHVLDRYADLWLLFIWTPTSLEQSGYIAHTSVSRCRSNWQGLLLPQRWHSSSNFSFSTTIRTRLESWT